VNHGEDTSQELINAGDLLQMLLTLLCYSQNTKTQEVTPTKHMTCAVCLNNKFND